MGGTTRFSRVFAVFAGVIASTSLASEQAARIPVFANDFVSVERITLDPGEGLPEHEGSERLIYSLSDYSLSWTESGKSTTVSWEEGRVHEHEALRHSVENVGNTVADFLVVARTSQALPVDAGLSDAASVSLGYAALIFDSEKVRVLRVALPPGAKQPMHSGAPRAVYSLNAATLQISDAEGKIREMEHGNGEMHWHDAGAHAVENLGSDTARFVVFAFKQ